MGLKAVSNIEGQAASIAIGTTTITGGTTGRLLYDNGAVVGETALWTTNGTIVTGATGSTLAIGGAAIGTNALAVTGTANISSTTLAGGTRIIVGFFEAPAAGGFLFSQSSDPSANADTGIGKLAAGSLSIDTNAVGNKLGSLSLTNLTMSGNLGGADAAVAVAQTTRVQSVVAGTAAANGANWTLIGSLPTGTGTSGDIIFQTGVKTGSGTTQGTPTTALTIKGETQAITIASGKSLVLGNSATTGLTAGVLAALTNATIVISDSTGQAYRIPCII